MNDSSGLGVGKEALGREDVIARKTLTKQSRGARKRIQSAASVRHEIATSLRASR